jgi:hypothetical protein
LTTRDEKPFALGILFVHGIGTQARGQTLAACGGPFCRWLEYRCHALAETQRAEADRVARGQRQLESVDWADGPVRKTIPRATEDASRILHRVALRETTFHDPVDAAAPAHTKVRVLSLDPHEHISAEDVLLAESCWANAFTSPSFADLARWGFGVLPWMMGSHFGAQVARRLRERPRVSSPSNAERPSEWTHREVWALTRWMWRCAAAIGGLGVGFLSTLVTIPILAVLLVLGVIPIPKLRSALLNVQLRLAATLGDCFVLLARPIEAAAIVSEVRRDLQWLAGKCSEVVIVAHSQGGAVAHLALRGTIPDEFRLLFTFGSGLRKLEEARELMRSRASFALSAVLTPIALVVALVCSALLLMAVFDPPPDGSASLPAIGIFAIGAVAICIAGISDHLRGIRMPELDRWIKWLEDRKVRWVDCYATGDPVPNGLVADAARNVTREVCNRSSMLSDHTSYWHNLDEFVSVLFGEISQSRTDDPLASLRVDPRQIERIAARRRWRAAIGRTIQWAMVGGVLAVVVRRWREWEPFATWAWSRTGAAIVDAVVGTTHAKVAWEPIDWTTVGLLLLVLVPYAIVRSVWSAWDHEEIKRALGVSEANDRGVKVLTGLWFLVIIATHIARYRPDGLSVWLFLLSFVPSVVFIALEPARSDRRSRAERENTPCAPGETSASDETSVGTLVSIVIGLASAATLPYGVGLAAWESLVWLTTRLNDGTLAGLRPASIPGEVIGGVAVLLTGIGTVIWQVRKQRGSTTTTHAG